MKKKIYCTKDENGGLSFYLYADCKHIYLYSSDSFSKRVYEEYRGGKSIDYIFRGSRAYNSQNTRERLIRTLAYIEKEEHISVLVGSGRRKAGRKENSCRRAYAVDRGFSQELTYG